MNKQFEPLFTPYDAWLWAHPPVYAIANGGLGAIRAKTTVFIVSKCNPRQDHRLYSFKMQQDAPILGASSCVKNENSALYWPR